MKRIRKCGIAFGVIGVVLLAVLVGIGAFVNNTLQKAPLAQLVFEVGDDNQHCSVSTSYYYFWNLTNKPETISGAKANFNLLGPYAFDSHSCTIDEEITSSTQLAYRTIEKGTFFNAEASKGSMYDEVTGANLAYITVLSKTGGEDGLLVAITGPGLQTIIETMQTPDFIQQVTVGSIPLVLSTIRSQSTAGLFVPLAAGGVSTQVIGGVVTNSNATLFAFFNDPAFELTTPISLKGYANWLTTIGQVTPINIPDDLAYVLYNSWISTSGASIFMFAADTAAVAAEFGIPTPIADQLKSYFGAYLLNPDTFDSATVYGISENLFYAQWTDGKYLEDGVLSQEGIPTALGYFEVGLPAPTGISEATAIQLWDPMSNYSLTSTNGIALWMGAAANATLIGKIATAYPSLNQTQIITVLTWLGTFYNNIAPILIKQSFGISDFSDLAYAQWGGMVLGQSLKELGNLDFTPEIAAFDSSIKYTAAQAKALLNGTYPLYDAKNIGALLTLVQSGSWSDINGMFGINATQAVGLAQYLNYIMGNLAAPIVMEATAEGSGLFVTRTVQEWLFTAHDPLLVALKEKNTGASIDSNTTDDLAAVRLKPKSTKKIYTKDATIDDLHASLMKQANPPIISDYAENFTVTGYTGTQFMPYNDVDTPKYPFEFWLGQIDRPLPLKNAGTADYKGVEVRHMVVSNDGFKSSAEDPSMAKFYQHITGMWNISALPPGTPLFVSRVEFAGADESVKENIMLTDNVTGEPVFDITNLKSTSIKGQWMQVEPFLGTTINANVAIQLSVKIDSSTLTRFNPNVRSMYAPVFWGRSGGQATEEDVNMIKTVLYGARLIWKALVGLGVGIGVVFMIIGIVMYIKGGKTKVVRLK